MHASNATGRRTLAALLGFGQWATPNGAPSQAVAAQPPPGTCARPAGAEPDAGPVPLVCTLKAIEVDDSGQNNGVEAFIQEALEQHPNRTDLRLKMLELHHAARDLRAFNRQARLYIQHNEGERGLRWFDVYRMGLDLDPRWHPELLRLKPD